MADPVFVNCVENEWTKVATNITTGQIHKAKEAPFSYLHTYRMTGEDDPSGGAEEGIKIFIDDSISEVISFSAAVDLYIYPTKADGMVRVDL